MRIEIPDCARCLACIPLRYGILIFGYLNLAFTLLLLGVEIYLIVVYETEYSISDSLQSSTTFMFRGVGMFSQTWFIFVLYSLEVVFNFILLIGAHRKITRLIRAYYYYGITTTLAAFLCYVVVRKEFGRRFEYYILEFAFAFAGTVLQVYLLLLVRTELNKLAQKSRMCFVNHAAEVYVEHQEGEDGRNPL